MRVRTVFTDDAQVRAGRVPLRALEKWFDSVRVDRWVLIQNLPPKVLSFSEGQAPRKDE